MDRNIVDADRIGGGRERVRATGMDCDGIAGWYCWIEYASFGPALARRRRAFVGELADARRVLVLGDGDGRFLEALLAANPAASVDYVDLSRGMLERARRRAGDGRVRYRQADARSVALPDAEYDLIATHFFLDCFGPEELAALVPKIAASASADARWVVSEFRVPRNRWAAAVARAGISLIYAFFGWTTGLATRALADHRPVLSANGFHLRESRDGLGGVLSSELWVRGGERTGEGSGAITP